MPKTEIRLVVFSCAWKQAPSWIFPEACKVFRTSLPNPVTQIFSMWVLCTNRIRTGKITCACFFVIFWKKGFSFYTLYSGGSWYDTLGARGSFFLVVCGENWAANPRSWLAGKKDAIVHMTQMEFKFMWSAASESIRKGWYFEFELVHLFLLVLHAWFSWE